jgi:Fe-S-cluster-containing dehydrogenase component
MMAKRYAMVIDTTLCVGCKDCLMACQTENNVPLPFFREWLVYLTSGEYPNVHRVLRSERCHHCDRPPCVGVCPTGASHRDEGGIVLVDPRKCTGCKACIAACPYNARFVHPEGYVDKCTFCIHRIDKGLKPACAEVCPTRCIHFGDIDDTSSEVSNLLKSRRWENLIPEAGTKPQLYFLY